jgi:F0F1-type ATP synthase membrane subunit c/vacuolar-type H+-ATPase subunit K
MMSNVPVGDAGFEARLRTLRILWVMFLITIGLFVLVTRLARPHEETVARMAAQDNTLILPVLAVVALASVAVSFVMRANFYRRAAEQQQPALLQTGFVVAIVLCEAAALLGLVGLFTTWNNYAYGLFALGALGELLHFPSREQLLSAYPRSLM